MLIKKLKKKVPCLWENIWSNEDGIKKKTMNEEIFVFLSFLPVVKKLFKPNWETEKKKMIIPILLAVDENRKCVQNHKERSIVTKLKEKMLTRQKKGRSPRCKSSDSGYCAKIVVSERERN